MVSTKPVRSTASHLHIEPLHPGSTRVRWTLFRDGKPVVTDIAENRKAAHTAARTAFANEVLKNVPKIDGPITTHG